MTKMHHFGIPICTIMGDQNAPFRYTDMHHNGSHGLLSKFYLYLIDPFSLHNSWAHTGSKPPDQGFCFSTFILPLLHKVSIHC